LALCLASVSMPTQAMQMSSRLSTVNSPSAAPKVTQIIAYLRSALGKRYRLGAAGENQAYDCSGLVQRAYASAGHLLPRVTTQQIKAGHTVSPAAIKAGDLLFYRFDDTPAGRLHVAVYIGQGRAIHASVSHKKVRQVDITTAVWQTHFITAVRPA